MVGVLRHHVGHGEVAAQLVLAADGFYFHIGMGEVGDGVEHTLLHRPGKVDYGNSSARTHTVVAERVHGIFHTLQSPFPRSGSLQSHGKSRERERYCSFFHKSMRFAEIGCIVIFLPVGRVTLCAFESLLTTYSTRRPSGEIHSEPFTI